MAAQAVRAEDTAGLEAPAISEEEDLAGAEASVTAAGDTDLHHPLAEEAAAADACSLLSALWRLPCLGCLR